MRKCVNSAVISVNACHAVSVIVYLFTCQQGIVSCYLCTNAMLAVLQSLAEPACYHEFCRLLARLKANFQLGELVRCEAYPSVIKLVAEFTVTSLQVRFLSLSST